MTPRHRTLALFTLLAAAAAGALAQAPKPTTDELRLARNAVRCSVVYGMAAAASRGASQASSIRRDLIRVAPKLGATSEQIDRWLAEFDAEFKDATSPSSERGQRMKDPGFMRYQIDWCQELLRIRGGELGAALDR